MLVRSTAGGTFLMCVEKSGGRVSKRNVGGK